MNTPAVVFLLSALALAGCTGLSGGTSNLQAVAEQLLHTPAPAPWEPFALPTKRYVPFEPVQLQGQSALRVRATSSVSILRQRFEPALPAPERLSLSWHVDGLPVGADLAQADRSDSPVGVLLVFDGDRARWTPRNHRTSEITRLLTGEELPYATLAYVWSNDAPVGTVVVNPRTDRIRKLVLDSGSTHVGAWRRHERDVRADFRRAFGEDPGPLRGVALMTDTDNTRSDLTAWYGPLRLTAPDRSR